MKTNEALNIVLVHGGFVDGSGWQGVYNILKREGHNVSVVQNPTTTLQDDVAVTKLTLDALDAPALLVGHSYGGAVITEAGSHPKVVGLVYIAAFAPSDGESVNTLIANPAPGAPVPPILPPVNGYLFLDKAKFADSFAGDVDLDQAAVHGGLAGAVGRRRARRHDHQGGVEGQAELVHGNEGRPDDPAGRAADDGQARGRDGSRGRGEPLHLRVSTRVRRRAHCEGSQRGDGRIGLIAGPSIRTWSYEMTPADTQATRLNWEVFVTPGIPIVTQDNLPGVRDTSFRPLHRRSFTASGTPCSWMHS